MSTTAPLEDVLAEGNAAAGKDQQSTSSLMTPGIGTPRRSPTMSTTIPTIPTMVERLAAISSAAGCETKEVTLTSVCSAALLLGAGPGCQSLLAAIAQHPDPARVVQQQWRFWQEHYRYLQGHLDPIIGWLERSDERQARVLTRQLAYLSTLDLQDVAEQAGVAGDLLGQVLTEVNAGADRSARGAFYTPPALASVLAEIGGVLSSRPNEVIYEPCVGGGGLVVAAVRALRANGQAPELRRWVLQDIDPYAVAVTGVAMSIHGMVDVHLTCGNSLAPTVPA